MYPESIKKVVECFKLLPGIGEKTAERLAFYMLGMSHEQINSFSSNLEFMKEKIHRCPVCNNYTESEKCFICSNDGRDNNLLCIVEDPKSIYIFEKVII